MPRRKVIADSEDEDEGDDVSLPDLGGDLDRPEPEPLSPQRQLSNYDNDKQLSDVTDPSFFANIYGSQQYLAVQQSHLIENIVRQSQRASASSGDVSLPSKKNRRRVHASSGTDVTSPMVLSRPRNHMTLFNDDASNITTPRKSMNEVWEIPSSPGDAAAPQSTKSAISTENAFGKMKKGRSKPLSSPAPTEMFAAEETTPRPPSEDVSVDYQLGIGPRTDSPPLPAAKRTKIFHHDSPLPDATKFYIAQSNLTTMQKLEYQRVNVSMNGYGGLPDSLPHQKSSCATTIPYSTPSGYSPVPPLPWEELPAPPSSPQQGVTINMSSSPDIITEGFDVPAERSPIADPGKETPIPDKNRQSPTRAQSQTPVAKGKKRVTQVVEDDELGRDDMWDGDDIDAPQDSYKPRATKPRSAQAAGFSDIGSKIDLENMPGEELMPTQDPPELLAPLEPQPEVPLKKRGRKKKQHTTEITPIKTKINEDSNSNQKSVSPEKASEAEPSSEKPKKRRGRPRKSGPSKAAEEMLPEQPIVDEPPITDSPQKDDVTDVSVAVSREQVNSKQKTKRKKGKFAEEVEDTESEDDKMPLNEVDSNLGSPSKPVAARGETPAKSRAGSNEEETPAPKMQSKETPKLAASQSKPTYRVGLSKRSRIAPLLKSIKK